LDILAKYVSKIKLEANPSLDRCIEIIREALSNRAVLIIAGNCSIDYSGRASSKIGFGERIVVVKSDNSIIIHRPRGVQPVNWQPSRSIIKCEYSKDFLKISSYSKGEVLNIVFKNIILISSMKLEDEAEFSMYATEEDMKKAILMNPNIIEEGFTPITDEKRISSGFIDIYGRDSRGNTVVIEVKKDTALKNDVIQLYRYVEGMRKNNPNIRGIIVSPSISSSAKHLLIKTNLEHVKLTPKRCSKIIYEAKGGKLILDSLNVISDG
jgi:RecB family endonuclease NucS